jgi:hypothetical protein
MDIVALTITDLRNPIEVQEWLDAHSMVRVQNIVVNRDVFYIFYE